MLRSLYLITYFALFFGAGLAVPFVASLAYVWVDEAQPQYIAYYGLKLIPVSLVMALLSVSTFCFMDRREIRVSAVSILIVIFAFYCTLSTFLWAVVPDAAYIKWNWAAKSVAFAAFLPLVFRSRVQIEAFLQVLLFSILTNVIGPGTKTLVTGGGYHAALGFVSRNSGLEEGSFLAATSVAIIPLILFLRKHNTLLPQNNWVKLGYLSLIVVSLAACVGTYERTGLVGLVVVSGFLWLQSRRKVLFGCVLLAGAVAIGMAASEKWHKRIQTIQTYEQDASALNRLLVWKWTWEFAKTHPFGGGFDSYRINGLSGVAEAMVSAENPDVREPKHPEVEPPPRKGKKGGEGSGRAFHSLYFEILGEQGYVGAGIFGLIVINCYLYLWRTLRRPVIESDQEWCRDLAKALLATMTTILMCGAFIGIGYQPTVYYVFISCVCLGQYASRVRIPDPVTSRLARAAPWRPAIGYSPDSRAPSRG